MKIDFAIKDYIFTLSTSEGKAKLTVSAYSTDLKYYLDFLNKKGIFEVEKIKDSDIDDYIKTLNSEYRAKSINRKKVAIRNFHKYLNFKYDLKDPSLNVTVSKGEKRLPVYATKNEIKEIMNIFDDENQEDIFKHCILETIYGFNM